MNSMLVLVLLCLYLCAPNPIRAQELNYGDSDYDDYEDYYEDYEDFTKAAPSPTPAQRWILGSDGKFYEKNKGTMTWTSAKRTCVARGGRLPVIYNSATNDAVRALTTPHHAQTLIDATDSQNEGQWRTSDGANLTFTNWNDGEPNNNGPGADSENCAEQVSNGKWNDIPCEYQRSFLCQFDSDIDSTFGIANFRLLSYYSPIPPGWSLASKSYVEANKDAAIKVFDGATPLKIAALQDDFQFRGAGYGYDITDPFPGFLFDTKVITACNAENLALTLHPVDNWPASFYHVAVVSDAQILFTSGVHINRGLHFLPADIIWGYTPSTSAWVKINTTGDHPPALQRACAAKLKGEIFLHGGYGTGSGQNDDLFIYNINENKWRKENGGGKGQQGSFCFGNKDETKFYVYGGGYQRELRTYHNGEWHSEITGPSGRSMPASVTVGETVFLHGGLSSRVLGHLDDFWRYNIAIDEWEKIDSKPGATKPQKRYLHSLAALSDDVLLLVGGYDNTGLNDVWTYTISTNEWKQHEDLPAESLGGPGKGLYDHSATSIIDKSGSQSVFVTGGDYVKTFFEFKLMC